MKETFLYDLLCMYKLDQWLVEEENKVTKESENEKELKEELCKKLNADTKAQLDNFTVTIKCSLCNIYYKMNIKTLNLGIKIGMELGESFMDLES